MPNEKPDVRNNPASNPASSSAPPRPVPPPGSRPYLRIDRPVAPVPNQKPRQTLLQTPQPSSPRPNDEGNAPPPGRPRMMRGGSSIAGALMAVIGRMDSGAQVRASLALAYWPRVVGAQAAAATQAESVRDGILFVRTKSSVWSHELNLHKSRLLLGLNRLLGGKIITDIIFRAQGVAPVETVAASSLPAPDELAAIVLEPEEKAELRGLLHDLHTVENDVVRAKIANCLAIEAKMRHWKLENGYHLCRRCQAPHNTDYPLCPVCRLCR